MRSVVVGLQRDARGVPIGMTGSHPNHNTKITVVAGPPGAGKNTYVQDRLEANHLVIDLDALAVALGSNKSHGHNPNLLPFMYEARDAIIKRLERPHNIEQVWVIRTAAKNHERRIFPGIEVIVLETPYDVAVNQAMQARRPGNWPQLIAEWWQEYERNPLDKIVLPDA